MLFLHGKNRAQVQGETGDGCKWAHQSFGVAGGYYLHRDRVPVISVNNAHLDLLRNDYAGLLQTQLTIVVTPKNGNARAHATFSDITFNINYQGHDIAILVADPLRCQRTAQRTSATLFSHHPYA
ncbi:hypothetical protein V8G54_020447 [Vigna mungo]|uniref:Late embryogenesis abundant protein LEA-2 subgroup domain-containing protein n=1 Tax=Vigna mungo TaxID=3915 RepID=A0AAQ3NDN8_VIGMU